MFSFAKKPPPPFLSAVIVAAGEASRMGGIDKQQTMVDEVPVVVRSVAQFESCPAIREIVLVCRESQLADYYRLVQDYGLDKVSSVVGGGPTRQESVFRGVAACSADADFFAIHDGARPLVSHWEIEQCIQAALQFGAAAVGTPVKDTVKVWDKEGFIRSTPDRETLVAIATPQIFAASIYRDAMAKAKETHRVYTDDCQLVETSGHRVKVSPGSYENIKITTPEDIVVAQAILESRGQEAGQWM